MPICVKLPKTWASVSNTPILARFWRVTVQSERTNSYSAGSPVDERQNDLFHSASEGHTQEDVVSLVRAAAVVHHFLRARC